MQNLPVDVYQASQVREIDRIAIHDYGISGIALILKAAQAAFEALKTEWPDVSNISVFCGAGNNAGDGYLLAALALQAGMNVTVYSIVETSQLTRDALAAYHVYQKAGEKPESFHGQLTQKTELIVDALLGTGLNRPIAGVYAESVTFINNTDCPVLAIDIPSGLNADTGMLMGTAVHADLTVTFIALKQGLFTGVGPEYVGKLTFADLDVPKQVFASIKPIAQLIRPLNLARRPRYAHKGHYGHVLVIGGDKGFSGAVRLAGQAALRTGAGLVSIASRASHVNFLNQGCYELMCHAVEEVTQLDLLMENASVIVLGPGLGKSEWGQKLFAHVIDTDLPLVVDADGLNLLAKLPHSKPNWVLTPHPKEAARLLNCDTAKINENRFAAVTALQHQYSGICLLKGAGSLIADGHTTFINITGNPGMASAGMGDVLSGIIAGLIAQGLPLSEAAKVGAYYHGQAADLAVQDYGERGLLASDLWPYLRKLIN